MNTKIEYFTEIKNFSDAAFLDTHFRTTDILVPDL